jgi:hypothetical protein
MGFAKAYKLANIDNLTSSISKPVGLIWLFVTVLFLIAAIGFLTNKPYWLLVAVVAIVISQTLIILIWKDARWGTIVNVLILAVVILSFARLQFQTRVNAEIDILLKSTNEKMEAIQKSATENLPKPVQHWLQKSGALEKEPAYCARIKQVGRMRTSPDGKWMNFTAEQYFDFSSLGFVWTTQVEVMPLVNMVGRDKFTNGEGSMLIKFLSLIPVVNESDNEKINSGTMLRYLGEVSWFPSTVLSLPVTWETIDSLSVKASLKYKDTHAEGIFYFSETGDFEAFEADRYYGGGADAKLERWRVEAVDYKQINGIRTPYKNRAIWKLKDGDFNWLELEITTLETNMPKRFD